MRLLLPLLLLLSVSLPAFAQDYVWNPYDMILNGGLSLDEGKPAIEALYPGAVDFAAQIDPALPAAGIVLLYDNHPKTPSAFLFCNEKLAGFSAVLPPAAAADILMSITSPNFPQTETYASADGVTVRYPDQQLSFQYSGIATPESFVSVNYPFDTFTSQDFAERCAEFGG